MQPMRLCVHRVHTWCCCCCRCRCIKRKFHYISVYRRCFLHNTISFLYHLRISLFPLSRSVLHSYKHTHIQQLTQQNEKRTEEKKKKKKRKTHNRTSTQLTDNKEKWKSRGKITRVQSYIVQSFESFVSHAFVYFSFSLFLRTFFFSSFANIFLSVAFDFFFFSFVHSCAVSHRSQSKH